MFVSVIVFYNICLKETVAYIQHHVNKIVCVVKVTLKKTLKSRAAPATVVGDE